MSISALLSRVNIKFSYEMREVRTQRPPNWLIITPVRTLFKIKQAEQPEYDEIQLHIWRLYVTRARFAVLDVIHNFNVSCPISVTFVQL